MSDDTSRLLEKSKYQTCTVSRRLFGAISSKAADFNRISRIALLFVLEPFRAFDDRVPSVYKRYHETVHAKVLWSAVVNGRPVAGGEAQIVVDLVP
jgi:hypothetical protein